MSAAKFIARRYLTASRENRFFSWISTLSIAGIAIGVAAMIVVLSVINGFEKELRQRFLAANAHVMIFRFPAGLKDWPEWRATVKKDFPDDIAAISPFIHHETMMRNDSIMHAVLIRGIHPQLREDVQPLMDIVRPKESLKIIQNEIDRPASLKDATPSIIIGSGLLSIIEAKIGDQVELLAPEDASIGRMKTFKVVGVYDSGLKHYDNRMVIMSIPTAQSFFRMGPIVTGIEIGMTHPDDSKQLAEKIKDKYAISVTEWQSINRSIFEAMNTERAVIALIVALVAFVASFNILTTIFVSVSQRQQAISVLKALGANNRQIQRLFLYQGFLIGLVGSAIGCILAVVISEILARYEFIKLPELYLLDRLPIDYNPNVYLIVSLSGVLLSLIAGIYPARFAAKVSPTQGIRGANRLN